MRKLLLSRADFDETCSTAEKCLRCANCLVTYARIPLVVQRLGTPSRSKVDPDLRAMLCVDRKPMAGTSRHDVYGHMADMFEALSRSLEHFSRCLDQMNEWHAAVTKGPFKAFDEWHITAHGLVFWFTNKVWHTCAKTLEMKMVDIGLAGRPSALPGNFIFPKELVSRDRNAALYVGRWMPVAGDFLDWIGTLDQKYISALLQIECSMAIAECQRLQKLDDEPHYETVVSDQVVFTIPLKSAKSVGIAVENDSKTIIRMAEFRYQIPPSPERQLSESEESVLVPFLSMPRLDLGQLRARSGNGRPDVVLRRLLARFPEFGAAIELPGKRRGVGYNVRIRKA